MNIDFKKMNGLVPAIIQDATTLQVLMLGYMNEEAYNKTLSENMVHFFSRSRNSLWKKGETSGNTLQIKNIQLDCDNDTLLVQVIPVGPVCHTGSTSCFGDTSVKGFLYKLETIIEQRSLSGEDKSYTRSLLQKGINKVAQKVGEEAIEVVIEAKDDNEELFVNEVADLLFHLLILLKAKNITLEKIEEILLKRHV